MGGRTPRSAVWQTPLVFIVAVGLVIHWVLSHTKIGRYAYAIRLEQRGNRGIVPGDQHHPAPARHPDKSNRPKDLSPRSQLQPSSRS
jgi:hypothetical protein